MIGKYFETGDFILSDSYLSVIEAIKYSAYMQNKKPVMSWLNATDFEKDLKKWKLNIDQTRVPTWWNKKFEKKAFNALKKYLNEIQ